MSKASVPDYTLIVGVDAYHLRQLELVWPTWKRHKPSLLYQPMIVFYDRDSTSEKQVRAVVAHPNLRTVSWPRGEEEIDWDRKKGDHKDKFQDPHRAMMLSGFVYVPAMFVETPHWLKLDTDVVATGMDDWIDPAWFEGDPAIVSHRWSFTKPADQMLQMDRWVEKNQGQMPSEIACSQPLNLVPRPGWDRLSHKRIISWCGFFDANWTRQMAGLTRQSSTNTIDGTYRLPISSQDGYLWYMATRGGREVVRANMKSCGWQHWHTWKNVEQHSREAMK